MKKYIFIILISLFFVQANSSAQQYVNTPVEVSKEKVKNDRGVFYSHIVKERQTLYSISKAYNVTIDQIYRANPDYDLEKEGLKKGIIIYIPINEQEEKPAVQQQEETQPEPQTQTQPEPQTQPQPEPQTPEVNDYTIHRVKWYEDLNTVAYKYDIPVEILMKYNNLSSTKVKKRQEIKIPNDPSSVNLNEEENVVVQEEQVVEEETPESILSKQISSLKDRLLNISKKNVDISLILPFNSLAQNTNSYYDFYSGALLAARDIAELGVNVNINTYDMIGGKLPLNMNLESSDFIIGPVSASDIEKVHAISPSDRYIISPLDPRAAYLADSLINVIHAPSSTETQYYDLVNWLKEDTKPEDRVILISEKDVEANSVASIMAGSGINYQSLSYGILEGRDIITTLENMMSIESVNRFVIASDKEAFVNDVIRNINLMTFKKFNVVLYAPSRFRNFDTIEVEGFHNTNMHVSSTYYIDYDTPEIAEFLMAYRALFNSEPSPYAFQGYDITYYFVTSILENGMFWSDSMVKNTGNGLQSDFRFEKTKSGGLVNKAVRRIVYEPGYRIKLL